MVLDSNPVLISAECFIFKANFDLTPMKSLILIIALIPSSLLFGQKTTLGSIILNEDDTIHCNMIIAKKRRVERSNNYQFVLAIIGNKTVKFKANDILGYMKNGDTYHSFKPLLPDSSFFAREITTGKITAYYSPESNGKYYFKKRNERHFNALDANAKYLVEPMDNVYIPGTGGEVINYNETVNPKIPIIHSNDEAFKLFFTQYLRSDPALVNKIRHGFYTLNTIESMFKDFNN